MLHKAEEGETEIPWSFLCNDSVSCLFLISLLKLKPSHKGSVEQAFFLQGLAYVQKAGDAQERTWHEKAQIFSLTGLQRIVLSVNGVPDVLSFISTLDSLL